MAKQKNPSITALNRIRYNVVTLPRVGIEALHVVGKDQTNQWLGPLSSVWKSESLFRFRVVRTRRPTSTVRTQATLTWVLGCKSWRTYSAPWCYDAVSGTSPTHERARWNSRMEPMNRRPFILAFGLASCGVTHAQDDI